MRTRWLWLVILAAVAVGIFARPARAQQAPGNPQEEAALMKNAEAFLEAFHQGDAKALAAFWTPDGDYLDETGRHFEGRQAIEEAFQAFFAENKGVKLRINVASVRFVTPELAIADGTTDVIPPDGGPPSRARYTNVHVKKGGQWYLTSVRDAPFTPPSNYEQLRVLEWAVGEWVSGADQGEVSRVSFAWSPERNFILSSHAVAFKDIFLGTGTQTIGWDPAANRIRSWTFEADGGFGEGSWAKQGDKWVIKTNSVLRDGKKLAATNVVTRVDGATITWQSKDRAVDGKPLPDSKEIRMRRVK